MYHSRNQYEIKDCFELMPQLDNSKTLLKSYFENVPYLVKFSMQCLACVYLFSFN